MRNVLITSSAALFLGLAAPAGAAVTVGNDLESAPVVAPICTAECTIIPRALEPEHQAAGGFAAVSGVVVRWRILNRASTRSADQGVTIALRTLRDGRAIARGPAQAVPLRGDTDPSVVQLQFPARVPVTAGDRIGIHMVVPGGANPARVAALGDVDPPETTWDLWQPALADGETRGPSRPGEARELVLSADIEPDVDGDGFGDESQDGCIFGNGSACPPPPPPPPPTRPGTSPPAPNAFSLRPPGTPGGPGGSTGLGSPTLAPADRRKPQVSLLRLSSRRLSFVLTERARVSIVVQQSSVGRLVRGMCRATTRSNRRAKQCELLRTRVRGTADALAGRNNLNLRGLRPGRYRIRIIATDIAGNRARAYVRTYRVRGRS